MIELRRIRGDDPAAVELVRSMETAVQSEYGPITPETTSVVSGAEMSPPGGAFVATDVNGIGEVYTVGIDGKGLHRVTTDLDAVGTLGWR